GRLAGVPRATIPPDPVEVRAASGALMMVRRDEFLALGGFYEPFFMYGEEADYCLRVPGRVGLTPASAIRHEYGHAAGPRFSPLPRYPLSRTRLVNASRHLPDTALAKAVLSSAAFDAATLTRSPNAPALRAVLRGWRDGLAAMPRERRAGDGAGRRAAAKRLVSFREADARHPRPPARRPLSAPRAPRRFLRGRRFAGSTGSTARPGASGCSPAPSAGADAPSLSSRPTSWRPSIPPSTARTVGLSAGLARRQGSWTGSGRARRFGGRR